MEVQRLLVCQMLNNGWKLLNVGKVFSMESVNMNKFKVNFFPKDQFTSYDFWDITWDHNGFLYGSPEVYYNEEEALNMADYYQKNPPINLSEWIKY